MEVTRTLVPAAGVGDGATLGAGVAVARAARQQGDVSTERIAASVSTANNSVGLCNGRRATNESGCFPRSIGLGPLCPKGAGVKSRVACMSRVACVPIVLAQPTGQLVSRSGWSSLHIQRREDDAVAALLTAARIHQYRDMT